MWTFGRKIAVGFALPIALLFAIGWVAHRSTTTLTQTSYTVAHTHQVLEHIAALGANMRDAETGQRGFVISGEDVFLDPYRAALLDVGRNQRELRELTTDNPAQQRRLDEMDPRIAFKLGELKHVIDARQNGFAAAQTIVLAGAGKQAMDDIRRLLGEMEREEHDLLRRRAEDVEVAAANAKGTIFGGTGLCVLIVIAAAFVITRSLTTQIGSAVKNVQSSSTELQAAATQQVTGAKEQATAMAEITTTINELLATSRQIAESAQRVAKVCNDAVDAARTGDRTVKRTQESLAVIRRQVDVIVTHMLELGKTSQTIGGILEIINELAEQTNILAINATIEAAGAGEAGKRFGVVAEEIRKLADRVSGSTKEIRGLVDDIRSAVNTTVMATEGGSKAVEAGAREFGEVASSFGRIVNLVATTTDAAREIELSTKQQTTAVEQVNIAISNVAQASRENEASSAQTLQTSSHLSTVSLDLSRLIESHA